MSEEEQNLTSSIGVRDSVIYHDPVKDSSQSSDEESVEAADDVFTTIARSHSVHVAVDKWSVEPTSVKEKTMQNPNKQGNSLDYATYAKVNKKRPVTPEVMKKSSTENLNDDALYGVVNKTAKAGTANASQNDDCIYEDVDNMQDASGADFVGHYDDLDIVSKDNIGNTEDLYHEVDERHTGRGQKTSCEQVDGKSMAISDDSDYASVIFPDSDISKNAETTGSCVIPVEHAVQKRNHNNSSKVSSSKSEESVNRQQNRYAVQYIGSVPIAESELAAHLSTVAVAQCIATVLNHSSKDPGNRVIYEWPKDTKMFMEISEAKQKLRLLNSHSIVDYDGHYLHAIRIWAVGKDANSKHFAYVIRNQGKGHVCRVFLCDITAKHVATSIRNICQRLASQGLKDNDESKRQSTYSVNSVFSGAAENLNSSPSNGKREKDGVSLMGITGVDKDAMLSTCYYIGVLKVKETTGKDTVNYATEKVFSTIPNEKWNKVDLCLSPSSINIKQLSNSSGNCLSLPTESVTHVASSTKNKRLAAILIQNDENVVQAHVFRCDPSAKGLVEQIQAICQIGEREKGVKGNSQKQKGLRETLFGKLMTKKQGSDIDSK